MTDQATLRQGTMEITATQYMILAENQQKKKDLADTKGKYRALLQDNERLLKAFEESQRESCIVAEHLRQEILHKNENIADLQNELQQTKDEKLADVNKIIADTQSRERQLVANANTSLEELTEKLQALQQQLDALHEFKERQVEVEAELLELRAEKQSLKELLVQQRKELERYYVEQAQRMKKEYEGRYEELKKAAEEDVELRLDAGVRRILAQNRRLAEELHLHMQETDALQSEVKVLTEERGRLLREVSLKAALEGGFARRSAAQSAAIKESSAKIYALEQSLQQVVKDSAKERMSSSSASEKQVAAVLAEAEGLRRLVKLKGRDLHNIRRLAHEVLLQRSDVETFLLSSLHHVRKAADQDVNSGQTAHMQAPSPAAGGVSSGQLSMADTEQVLRLLLAKINNQAQQAHFCNLPPHTFTAAQLEGDTALLQGLQMTAAPAAVTASG